MSIKSDKLKEMLFNKTNYEFNVWYERICPYGWLFDSSEFCVQRLGYNYRQAIEFIENYDWKWIKDYLNS